MSKIRAQVGEMIAQNIRDSISEQVEIKYIERTGNNGTIVEQIQVRKKDESVGARIYIEKLINQWLEGTITIQEAGIHIMDQALKATDESEMQKLKNMTRELNDEKILNNVICQLVNYERNKEMLEAVPYTKWLDLAIVYRYICDEIDGSFLVTNEMLEKFDISLETLKQEAYENTSKEQFKIDTMAAIMGLPGCGEDILVGTTEKGIYGAIVMTFRCMLEEASNINDGSDLYIIPSSIHEVIILKAEDFDKSKELIDLVREVNASDAVQDVDILSDNIYKYNADKKCVTLLEA